MPDSNSDPFDRCFEAAMTLTSRLTSLRAFVTVVMTQPADMGDSLEWARRADLFERLMRLTDEAAAEFLEKT